MFTLAIQIARHHAGKAQISRVQSAAWSFN